MYSLEKLNRNSRFFHVLFNMFSVENPHPIPSNFPWTNPDTWTLNTSSSLGSVAISAPNDPRSPSPSGSLGGRENRGGLSSMNKWEGFQYHMDVSYDYFMCFLIWCICFSFLMYTYYFLMDLACNLIILNSGLG